MCHLVACDRRPSPPLISPPSNNTLLDHTWLTLTCSDSPCRVYYTLDGTVPQQTSEYLYTGPVLLRPGGYYVRARVNATGFGVLSADATASCTFVLVVAMHVQ